MLHARTTGLTAARGIATVVGVLALTTAACGKSPAAQHASSSSSGRTGTASRTPTGTAGTQSPGASAAGVATPTASTLPDAAHLCSGTTSPSDGADAFMGALAAGNGELARSCLAPGAQGSALIATLLLPPGAGAAYLPTSPAASSGSMFSYTGNGKTVVVTVARQQNGDWLVSDVSVS